MFRTIFCFRIAQSSVIFTAQTTYSTGPNPMSVAVDGVNGNNSPDIIVANVGSNTVGVLINTGNGTFTNQTSYSTGALPRSVAVVDINGDNNPDIIVANEGS